jgi:DNA-binding response OmpR family regulator
MDDRPTDPDDLEPCDVLVVDDDFALSEAISQFLMRSGVRVRKAHSAASALSSIAFAPPRVAIVDYQLPDGNGLVLSQEMHAELPKLHIILMSANSVDIDRKTLDQAGIKVFVPKPMPPGPLRQAVLRLLQRTDA